MKRVLLLVAVVTSLAITITSCGKAKETSDKTVEAVKDAADKTVEATKNATEALKDEANKAVDAVKDVVVDQEKLDKGKALFTSKTCTACHKIDEKFLGPSIKDIVKVYDEKGANMVKFLKGNGEAIVDTDPAQVAIMKANIDGFLKDMKAEDLQALASYMRSVAK